MPKIFLDFLNIGTMNLRNSNYLELKNIYEIKNWIFIPNLVRNIVKNACT